MISAQLLLWVSFSDRLLFWVFCGFCQLRVNRVIGFLWYLGFVLEILEVGLDFGKEVRERVVGFRSKEIGF